MSMKTLGGRPLLLVFALTVMSCTDKMPPTASPESRQIEQPEQPKQEPKEQKKDNKQDEAHIIDLNSALKYGAMLVDVRTPEEFAAGSVSGAVNIPLSTIGSRLEEFKGKKGILVFCRSGNRSRQAKAILDKAGIPNVINPEMSLG
ncbi:MAG: rhodanese-like domain-containing protein [Porphyromonadaceae bacterium]|nr:rhodanese-like domain-containing protein [Porphyromonadaceae bacterium]